MYCSKISRHRFLVFFMIIFSSLLLATNVHAGAEEVYIAKIMDNDNKAIIVRRNGEAYLIEKGIGCISLWRYEGKKVLIISPGLFLGIGSKLLIPENGQECRIWDSKELGTWRTLSSKPSESLDDTTVKLVQTSLKSLGFYVGPLDGKFEEGTKSALKAFQEKEKIPPTGSPDSQTYLALSKGLYEKYPNDKKMMQLALTLLNLAKKNRSSLTGLSTSSCDDGHWISSVSSGGDIVILEDSSVWQVDSIDTIYTSLWLSTESIIVCGSTMINTDNGDKVRVTRLK